MSTLGPEIWYLVFQTLDTRYDLRNVSQVCKSFSALASPILYRSIILRTSRPTPRGRRRLAHWIKDQGRTKNNSGDSSLLSRLLNGPNERLRRFVRVVELGQERYSRDIPKLFRPHGDPETVLVQLIEALPNLESLCLREAFPLSVNVVDALCKHKNSPAVHLLGERGSTQVERQVPCVQSLNTCVRVYSRGMETVKPSLALHELFFAYPNLKDLSVGLDFYRNRGPAGGSPLPEPVTRIESLALGESDSFPPIQSLALNDYHVDAAEWKLWESKFPWASLKTLVLGPVQNHSFLQQIKGYTQNLSKFEIYAYSSLEMHSCPALNDFLLSFDTLEVLAVKQCWPSLNAVVHHSNLRSLTFHATENRQRKRHLLDLEDLEFLDRMCTELEFLEIDIRREDEWPGNTIAALARGFANLRELSLHVGLDIHRGNIEPTLTKITANEFAEVLLCYRVSTSKLKRVTLKTGENLRDFRDVKPRYAREEEDCAAEFEIRAPYDGIGEWVVEERTVE